MSYSSKRNKEVRGIRDKLTNQVNVSLQES